jgi:hypothetical protein
LCCSFWLTSRTSFSVAGTLMRPRRSKMNAKLALCSYSIEKQLLSSLILKVCLHFKLFVSTGYNYIV